MNKSTKVFLVVGVLSCILATARAESYEVIRWLDGFESHTCGDYLQSYSGHEMYPDIPGAASPETLWGVTGWDDLFTTIDCTKAYGGTQSVEQAWNGSNYSYKGSTIVAYPQYYDRGDSSGPHIMIRPGCTTVVEVDVNFNYDATDWQNSGEGEVVLVWHGSTLPVAGWYSWNYGGVRYLNGPGYVNYVDSAITAPAVVPNVWHHYRMEIYDDFTYSVFVTLNGQTEQTAISGVPCQNVNPSQYTNDYLELRLMLLKGIINWDNVKISYIANDAQGYRDIYEVPAGIVVDGSLGVSEWAEATKVAAKPISGDGVFKSTSTHQNVLLDPNQYIDVYAANDSDSFYIAASFDKVSIDEVGYQGSFFEAVFTYDPNVVYVYACSAEAASGSTGLLTKFVGIKDPDMFSTWNLDYPGLDYSDFTNLGGQIAYSVNSGVMDVEMKIPFSSMPEFEGVVAGNKVNLQFNVTGSASGTSTPEPMVVYTTNIGFEQYPWQRSNADVGTPFGAGIAFPVCGDADNQWPVGDLSQDCIVNIDDLAILAENWLVGK